MTIENIEVKGNILIHLIADEGKVLIKDDIMSESVYLGKNDSIENWSEIDAPEDWNIEPEEEMF